MLATTKKSKDPVVTLWPGAFTIVLLTTAFQFVLVWAYKWRWAPTAFRQSSWINQLVHVMANNLVVMPFPTKITQETKSLKINECMSECDKILAMKVIDNPQLVDAARIRAGHLEPIFNLNSDEADCIKDFMQRYRLLPMDQHVYHSIPSQDIWLLVAIHIGVNCLFIGVEVANGGIPTTGGGTFLSWPWSCFPFLGSMMCLWTFYSRHQLSSPDQNSCLPTWCEDISNPHVQLNIVMALKNLIKDHRCPQCKNKPASRPNSFISP